MTIQNFPNEQQRDLFYKKVKITHPPPLKTKVIVPLVSPNYVGRSLRRYVATIFA